MKKRQTTDRPLPGGPLQFRGINSSNIVLSLFKTNFIFYIDYIFQKKKILHPKHKIQHQFQTLDQNACYFTPKPYMGTHPH